MAIIISTLIASVALVVVSVLLLSNLKRSLSLLDQKIRVLMGQSSQVKGKLGELVTYTRLKAEYDRIYSINGIADFIGIKTGTDPRIDFIEVKTNTSRMSKDQQDVKRALDNKNVRWVTVKLDTIILGEEEDEAKTNAG